MNVVERCGEIRPDAGKSLILWRPRRDLNPCYRRERAFQAFLVRVAALCISLALASNFAIFVALSSSSSFGYVAPVCTLLRYQRVTEKKAVRNPARAFAWH